jgi:hypothetical protein
MKKIRGFKIVEKEQQKDIKGGIMKFRCETYRDCEKGFICSGGICIHGEI